MTRSFIRLCHKGKDDGAMAMGRCSLILLGVAFLLCAGPMAEQESFVGGRKISFGKRTMSLVGGWRSVDPSDPDVVGLAKFAVEEHNKKLTGRQRLLYSKVVEAKKQVVEGVMYRLTVEALARNEPSQYEARVWVKEWQNFKELVAFKLVK